MFVLDYVPEQYTMGGPEKSVMLFTAGWAMKFVPLLGRALKEMALDGHLDLKLENFSILRHNLDPETKKHHSIIHNSEKQTSLLSSNFKEADQACGSSLLY